VRSSRLCWLGSLAVSSSPGSGGSAVFVPPRTRLAEQHCPCPQFLLPSLYPSLSTIPA
jgi:hypothetical protein